MWEKKAWKEEKVRQRKGKGQKITFHVKQAENGEALEHLGREIFDIEKVGRLFDQMYGMVLLYGGIMFCSAILSCVFFFYQVGENLQKTLPC